MNKTNDAVLVFGGTGAIGRGILRSLALRKTGFVLATYQSEEPQENDGTQWLRFQASNGEGCEQIRVVLEQYNLLAAFFCIGIPSTKRQIVDTKTEEWVNLFSVNAVGFVRAYSAIADSARRSQSRIIVLSSDTTRTLGSQNGPYTASKAALEAIVQTLAKEEAQFGVRLTTLAPSLVDSPLADHILELKGITDKDAYDQSLPWGRPIALQEVSEAAVSLALDVQWGYCTGQIFRLASGR
jgi:NAD(P)-dependent dehydrogenase (short-subunit alcohol dehydrogenase family)